MTRDTERFVCLTFHTERLHDDRVWKHVKDIAGFLNSRGIAATWFSIAPVHPAYVEQKYPPDKWADRLKELSRMNQLVEQHTHFYKATKGPYDLSPANLEKRLLEDKNWLECQGFDIRGFVSGGWAVSKDLFRLLVQRGFAYDCSLRAFPPASGTMAIAHPTRLARGPKSLVEIPTSSGLTLMRGISAFLRRRERKSPFDKQKDIIVLYLHDYDLTRFQSRMALEVSVVLLSGKYRFVTPRELSEYLNPNQLAVKDLGADENGYL